MSLKTLDAKNFIIKNHRKKKRESKREKLDLRGIMSKDEPLVSWEELAVSTMLEVQAIIKILERKGLVTKDEILKEVEVVKKEMEEEIRRMGREN
jgi:hypothetical protein